MARSISVTLFQFALSYCVLFVAKCPVGSAQSVPKAIISVVLNPVGLWFWLNSAFVAEPTRTT